MLPTPFVFPERGERSIQSNHSDHHKSEYNHSPKLSDVPCYTCRRRHVKCDKLLPNCAKCAKKGVSCLGYLKPLRWADGVAVRGKLKGKTQPIMDNDALSTPHNILDRSRAAVHTEAAKLGFAPLESNSIDISSAGTAFQELIRYHNTVICAEHAVSEQHPVRLRILATITPLAARRLPRDFLNGILTVSAVHYAVRNPKNRALGQMALQMKATLFEGMNNAFQQPEQQRVDLLLSCITLMSAIDIIEHGVDNWKVHFSGALNLVAMSGGMARFASSYPHMKCQLSSASYMETMLSILSPVLIEEPKLVSPHNLKNLCFAPEVRESFFATCPLPLLRTVYDTITCARNIIQAGDCPSAADLYTREWVLADVLHFQPSEGIEDVRKAYYPGKSMSPAQSQIWNAVFSAWRSAIIIVTLRHLYFGLNDSEALLHLSRSPTPNPTAYESVTLDLYTSSEEGLYTADEASMDYRLENDTESYFEPGRLSPEARMKGNLSWTPSPLPSPRPTGEEISFDHWHRRYDIHNEATEDLSRSFSALSTLEDALYLRYALLPLIILALISRPGSNERALALSQFQRFTDVMNKIRTAQTSIGGFPLEFDIPWDRLDSFSAEMEQHQHDDIVNVKSQLHNAAPEWNWWHMLKRIDLKQVWPAIAGTAYTEEGAEFWAFNVLSTSCTKECFAAFMQPPPASAETSTST